MGGNVHANPPDEMFEHTDHAGNSQVAGGGGVAGVYYPRAHQHRNVHARGWGSGMCAVVPGVAEVRWSSIQEDGVVVGVVELAFSCKGKHVGGLRAPGR